MARKDKRGNQAPAKAQKKVKTPAEITADKLRYHRELESRWAIFNETRVEFFRGKDFADVVRKHPDIVQPAIPADEVPVIRQPLDEVLMDELLRSGLAVRCDRVVKTLRPGRKKLSKWPARLDLHKDQVFSTNDGFYAWTFERKQPIWQTILSFLLPVFTVACCLFPVFPHWCKLAVLYFLLGLIAVIFGLLIVRLLIFATIWLVLGKRVWFFPSILAEEGSLAELFRFWPDKDDQPPSKLTSRLAVSLMIGFTFWLMVTYAPNQDTRARYQKKVTNIIDDVLQWSPQMLAGKTTPPNNATSANATSANATDSMSANVTSTNHTTSESSEASVHGGSFPDGTSETTGESVEGSQGEHDISEAETQHSSDDRSSRPESAHGSTSQSSGAASP